MKTYMKRASLYLAQAVIVAAILSRTSVVRAQSCSGVNGFYTGTCASQIDSTSGDWGYYGGANNGVGVYGDDSNGGTGVVGGSSGTGIGVAGFVSAPGGGQSYSQPSGNYGIYGDGHTNGDGVHGTTSNSGVWAMVSRV